MTTYFQNRVEDRRTLLVGALNSSSARVFSSFGRADPGLAPGGQAA